MAVEILRKIGLSEGEIKIYTALLELGKSPVSRIHERVGIERRNIYDILNKLIERGLVTYVTENRQRLFQITHPNRLVGYIDEENYALEQTKKEIKNELPDLIEQFESKKPKINAEIYRGMGGIKAVFEDMLNYKENYSIGAGRYVVKLMPHFWVSYNRRRIKLGVRWNDLLRAELKKGMPKLMPLENRRFLPKEFRANPIVILIYGSKVANVLWGKEFFAFVIENREIAENYRKYFQYLWKNVAKN